MAADRYTVVRGAQVLGRDFRSHEPADVLIKNNRIDALCQPGAEVPGDALIIEATDKLVMPGLVNAHTHGHGGLGKGWGDRWTLELLLNAGPWISSARTLEHKYLAATLSAAEMISKGCTAAYDLYVEIPVPTVEGMHAVGQAYRDAGLRAVVTPMVADRTFFEAVPGLIDALPGHLAAHASKLRMAPAERTLGMCRELIERWPFDRRQVGVALGPTIPLHCTDDYLTGHRDLARELDVGLHMHVAESKIQALSGLKTYGKTLVAHLDALGLLHERFTAAHAVWLDTDDIKRMADAGASVAHNPGSNMRLGSGFAAVREMHDAGVNIGIGTDGAHCADNQNMFEAMRFASFVSRTRTHDYERWLATDEVLGMATTGSARALGMPDDYGVLQTGALADLVLIDLRSVNWLPVNDPANLLVHTENGQAVDSVMIDGELVYENREFLTIDIDALRVQASEALEDLTDLNADTRALCDELEHHVGHFCVGLARSPYHVHALAGHDY